MCRYTDASGEATEVYPFNPNGSPDGIAALTSANGRHLAIMPHPERCFMTWQNPWCVLVAPSCVSAGANNARPSQSSLQFERGSLSEGQGAHACLMNARHSDQHHELQLQLQCRLLDCVACDRHSWHDPDQKDRCRYPRDIGLKPDGPSPWLKLFQNAREWCCSVSK